MIGGIILIIIITAVLVSYLGWWGYLITGTPVTAYIIWWIIDEQIIQGIVEFFRRKPPVTHAPKDKAPKGRASRVDYPDDLVKQAFHATTAKPIDASIVSPSPSRKPPPNCPDDWWDIRERVLARDRYKCVLCGESLDEQGHAHHIVKKSEGGSHHYSNLVSLCRACHSVMDGHTMMSHPGYILNPKTKCAHVYSCRYVSGLEKSVPTIPDGYRLCRVCRPTEKAAEIARASFRKKRRLQSISIRQYLENETKEMEVTKSPTDEKNEKVEEPNSGCPSSSFQISPKPNGIVPDNTRRTR